MKRKSEKPDLHTGTDQTSIDEKIGSPNCFSDPIKCTSNKVLPWRTLPAMLVTREIFQLTT